MARLWSCGFELASVTAGHEMNTFAASASISATARTGSNALRLNPSAAVSQCFYAFASSAPTISFYRIGIRITTAPSAQSIIWALGNDADYTFSIRVNTDRSLALYNQTTGIQIGSSSAALDLNTYYYIEVKSDGTTLTTDTATALLNGSQFATGAANHGAVGLPLYFYLGDPASQSFDILLDDIAINDNSGSFQNTYAGDGGIVHLRPSGTGDNAAWNIGGTDSGAHWSQTEEITPNDVTDYITSETAGEIDDFNIDDTPAAIGASDTINVVSVGVRFRVSSTTSADPDFVLRVKASASGTVEESAAIDASSATWFTNKIGSPKSYNLTLYDLPGASTTAWTKSTLDTAQIGVRETVTDAHFVWVSTLWMLVDFTVSAAPPAGNATYSSKTLLGVGL